MKQEWARRPIARRLKSLVKELLPDVREGRIEPGRVFDRVVGLEEMPGGYRAMNEREAFKRGDRAKE